MEPEDLVKLRHPRKFVGGEAEAVTQSVSVDSSGTTTFKNNEAPKQAAFVKAVSNAAAFCQLWGTYVSIRSNATRHNPSFTIGYLLHMHNILAKALHHPWHKVMAYHLEVHRKRMISKAPAAEWMKQDSDAFMDVLAPATLPVVSAATSSSIGAQRNGPHTRSTAPYVNSQLAFPFRYTTCQRFNRNQCVGPCVSSRPHLCAKCNNPHSVIDCPMNPSGPATGVNVVGHRLAPGVNGATQS